MDPEARLQKLDADLPEPMSPRGTYRAAVRSGDRLHIAGQGPVRDGDIVHTGRLGDDVDVETGYDAARLTGLNVLAVARDALGSLDEVDQVVEATVFVAATADFERHPQIADGATDLFEDVFGQAGRPARAAVGAASLPMGIPVEATVAFEVDV